MKQHIRDVIVMLIAGMFLGAGLIEIWRLVL